MKKLIVFILAFTLMVSLVVCASADATQGCEPEERFTLVYADGFKRVIVDTQTGVQYLEVRAMNGTGVTVLVNPDGTPMIWEG